jgi:hypothetical protein
VHACVLLPTLEPDLCFAPHAGHAQGCTHSRGSCLSCCDAQPVAVHWDVLTRLEHAFSNTGAMPRPTSAEARAGAVPLRSLVAGEITWPGIFGMFQFADAAPGDSFLDCGAGHGRAVAAFTLAFGGCGHGVEIRPQLAKTAQACLLTLQQEQRQLPAAASGSMEVSLGDIFAPELDWGGYDIVLVNATGFDEALMLQCSNKLLHPPPSRQQQPPPQAAARTQRGRRAGQRVLVLSQPLPPPYPAPSAQRAFKMSWGQCTVYLYRRV